jgi:uncharacterized protein YnzC (UPF0291/DUF896 family)
LSIMERNKELAKRGGSKKMTEEEEARVELLMSEPDPIFSAQLAGIDVQESQAAQNYVGSFSCANPYLSASTAATVYQLDLQLEQLLARRGMGEEAIKGALYLPPGGGDEAGSEKANQKQQGGKSISKSARASASASGANIDFLAIDRNEREEKERAKAVDQALLALRSAPLTVIETLDVVDDDGDDGEDGESVRGSSRSTASNMVTRRQINDITQQSMRELAAEAENQKDGSGGVASRDKIEELLRTMQSDVEALRDNREHSSSIVVGTSAPYGDAVSPTVHSERGFGGGDGEQSSDNHSSSGGGEWHEREEEPELGFSPPLLSATLPLEEQHSKQQSKPKKRLLPAHQRAYELKRKQQMEQKLHTAASTTASVSYPLRPDMLSRKVSRGGF